jgi:hypothetical protein
MEFGTDAQKAQHLPPIIAGTVILATNAFTNTLLPDLAAIQPYQSQIQVTECVADRVQGRIVTSDNGPVFFNQPRDGASYPYAPLLMGGGDDRPMKNPHSRRRSPKVHEQLLKIRDSFYPELKGQPPSAEWIGPMAFTPDGLPCIGCYRPGVIVAAAASVTSPRAMAVRRIRPRSSPLHPHFSHSARTLLFFGVRNGFHAMSVAGAGLSTGGPAPNTPFFSATANLPPGLDLTAPR